jgi:hypothetical protein
VLIMLLGVSYVGRKTLYSLGCVGGAIVYVVRGLCVRWWMGS